MAFSIKDYHDLVRLLKDHPEWQSDLRQLLLSEELLTLPEAMQELVTAQQQTDKPIEALTAAHQRAEERLWTEPNDVQIFYAEQGIMLCQLLLERK